MRVHFGDRMAEMLHEHGDTLDGFHCLEVTAQQWTYARHKALLVEVQLELSFSAGVHATAIASL